MSDSKTVIPQQVTDPTILDSVAGFINEVVPTTHSGAVDDKDQIQWASFQQIDCDVTSLDRIYEGDRVPPPPVILVLGYTKGVQVWAIPSSGEATQILSWRHSFVKVLKFIVTPSVGHSNRRDLFASKRPLIALCDSSTMGSQYSSLSLMSLKTGEQVKCIKFINPILDVFSNSGSVVVTFREKVAVFDAFTLENRLNVTTCYVSPGLQPNPVALGARWLAYAEKKLNPSKKSNGGNDGEGVQSYTATVLYAAKSLGKGLREFGESFASSLAGTPAFKPGTSPNSPQAGGQADIPHKGVVTILDIESPFAHFLEKSAAACDPVVAHFAAHTEAIVLLKFDPSGMLLFTADKRGHDFHLFRIHPHPGGAALAAVHHLYVLHRGDTTAKVQDMCFSPDSRWASVSTLRGTTHVFPITPYGGNVGVRTHTTTHVVNKMSRYHRSAGLTVDGRSNSPIAMEVPANSHYPYHNPRFPPYPRPTVVNPLSQIRQPVYVQNTGTSPQRPQSGRQRLSSSSEDYVALGLVSCFAPPRAWLDSQSRDSSIKRQQKPVESLFIMSCYGTLTQYDLDPHQVLNVPKERVSSETPIELTVWAKAQWFLQRPPVSEDVSLPMTKYNLSFVAQDVPVCKKKPDQNDELWLSQVEIITHAGPHRRLWMGPQFTFKTITSGSPLSLAEAQPIDLSHTKPVNMPFTKANAVLIESTSASSCEQSLLETYHRTLLEGGGIGESKLREDLADAMIESPGIKDTGETFEKRNGMKEPDHFGETLPDGVQLTLSELRDMACRQQAQIESQHQLLAAKEQRLRYLKEQEQRQQRVQAESERLRRLRDRVDAQELKLRKLRALRGQVDHQKQNNISLTSDLDSIRALFNEKEKELSLAVAKVEELTRQLEELRRGRSTRDPPPPSALELDKLRRELMYRNKLNEQQNQRLYQQREALTARQEEMSAIDKRISELQERLHKKRLLNQQLANQISAASHKAAYHQLVRLTGNSEQNNQAFARKQQQNNQANGLSRGNIAAVEPYNHVPIQPIHQIKNTNNPQENSTYHHPYQPIHHIKKDADSPKGNNDTPDPTKRNASPPKSEENNDVLKDFTVSKNDPKYQTLPYNTKFTVNLVTGRVPKSEHINNNDDNKEELSSHISNNVNGNFNKQSTHMTVHSAPLSMVNKNIATPLNQHDLLVRRISDNKDDSVNGNDDIIQRHTREHIYPNSTSTSVSMATTYQKPISSVAPTSIHHTGILSNVYQTSSIKVQPVEPQTISTSKHPTSIAHHTHQHQIQSPQSLVLSPPQSSSTPLNNTPEVIDKSPKPALPPKPAIKPPPRQTQVLNEETVPPPLPLTDPPDEIKNLGKMTPTTHKQAPSTPASSTAPNNAPNTEMIIKAKPLTIKKQPLCEQPKLRSMSSYSKLNGLSNRRIEMPPTFHFPELQNLDRAPESFPEKDETDKLSLEETDKEEKYFDGVIRRCKKGNLKQTGKSNLSRRVSFDPLALLLDASLEGELELVKKTATQVINPSAANDEGITALHNAICAGHLEIVKFLVEFGCDVNAQDSDGWTPLHCAASCNNLTMVKFLVEHGACIFATTLSDHETAAEKCEEDEEGFDGCSEYLYSVQEKLGILSGGVVYAVFDYTAQQADELTFKEGQQLTVLRKGDENEREWWWSRIGDKEGYIPRNLLGLHPRVTKNEECTPQLY